MLSHRTMAYISKDATPAIVARWLIIAIALAFGFGLVPSARSQSLFDAPGLPPVLNNDDGNRVDLVNGNYHYSITALTIGAAPPQGGLVVRKRPFGPELIYPEAGNLTLQIRRFDDRGHAGHTLYTISSFDQSYVFLDWNPNNNSFKVVSDGAGGRALLSSCSDIPTAACFTDRTGMRATFVPLGGDMYLNTKVDYPNGVRVVYNYLADNINLQSAISSAGYAVQFQQNGDMIAINTQLSPCSPAGVQSCSGQPNTETVHWSTYTDGGVKFGASLINAKGETTKFSCVQYNCSAQFPGSAANDITYTSALLSSNSFTITVTRPAGAWTYTFVTGAYPFSYKTTVQDPTGVITTVNNARGGYNCYVLNGCFWERPASVVQGTGANTHTWTLGYSLVGQLNSVSYPEGDSKTYSPDDVYPTSISFSPKPGSPQSPRTMSIVYYGDCTNYPARCYKPQTYTDARGAVTTYQYDANGFLLSETLPSPTAGVAGRQDNYVYQSVAAPGGGAIELLMSKIEAFGTASAVTTTYGYAGSPNLLPTSITKGSGALQAKTLYSYTPDGDLDTETDPLGQPTRYYHDPLRRVVGIVGPDPDGSGPLRYPATDTTYDGNGRVVKVARGTVTDQSSGAGGSFAPLETHDMGYDAGGRMTHADVMAGGTTVSSTDYTYDAANRPLTTTVRMFGQGSDRVTSSAYDPASGLLTSTTTASGTADASTVGYTYTLNEKRKSLTDGNNNTTNYAYDGFDRLQMTTYADSSTEVLGYDAASNVTSDKRRDGQVIGYTYDTVNQVRTRSGAGLSNGYTYDTLGRLTSATGGSYNVSRTYDALGHMLTDTTGGNTITNGYDAAGRRTSVASPGGGGLIYQYLATGDMSAIVDGASRTIGFTYDDLGRRTHLSYPNGRSVDYSYGADLRLASLAHHMTGGVGNGTQNDVAYGYGYNPAGQITSRSTSNDSYAYSPVPTTTAYTPNALNQLTSSTTPFTYDPRGNQTAVGGAPGQSRAFSVDNKLTDAGTGASPHDILGYDALDRLASVQVGTGGGVTRLVWDGDQITSEYDASGLIRLYGYGPGTNEVLVLYPFTGSTEGIRYFHADERGSIVALTDINGQVLRIHDYDAYGREGAAAHLGRFGYAGGVALPESGLTHFRARAYDPQTGRFVSADPIGTEGGINLYAYVNNDPLDATDPKGTSCISTGEHYVCNIDKVDLPKGQSTLTSQQAKFIARFNAKYTSAVNRVATANHTFTVGATGGRPHTSFKISGMEVASSLAKREVTYSPERGVGQAGIATGGNPSTGVFSWVYSPEGASHSMERDIIHDGIHSTSAEYNGNALAPVLGVDPYNSEHQEPYNRAAGELLGTPNE